MRILMITTYFYPDTAIAAKRPYCFAKYLASFGHDVTVLRSGDINRIIDESIHPEDWQFRTISYKGTACAAECRERGVKSKETATGESRIGFLPLALRIPMANLFHRLNSPKEIKAYLDGCSERRAMLEHMLTAMHDRGEQYDIVFSTFGELENVFGGELASELFRCPWILDLRDPIVRKEGRSQGRKELMKAEQRGMNAANACTTVSYDLARILQERYPGANVIAIHNGYDGVMRAQAGIRNRKLVMCYTGKLYKAQTLEPLFLALQESCARGSMSLDNLRFVYAGPDYPVLARQAKMYQMEAILENRGYVSHKEATELQLGSDLFIVASWNTRRERGVLTGKFYEGIQTGKPILAVVNGEIPNSELYAMNQKYNYGFCYENCRRSELFDALQRYMQAAYDCKLQGREVPYAPSKDPAEDFAYEMLTRKLESLMLELTERGHGAEQN